jgi:NhaP-type Na+/H+ or K+/H+ antiporter
MASTEILVVMLIAIALTIFAERHRMQPPLVLVLVGLVVSYIPGLQAPHLEPADILTIVLPPLLYSAALDFSFFSFMRRIGSILNLSVALVIVSTLVVGWVASLLMPSLSMAGALILGAALAPPDAVSAVSIGRTLGLPNRLMTVMKGESLVNDAAALTLFAVAVGLATGGHETIGGASLTFLRTAIIGALTGMAVGGLVDRMRRRLSNPTLVTTLAILVPFTAYALAERWHASGVLAVVFAGFTLSHRSADLGFAGRIQERAVWHVVDSLLETFAFAYMGLQLRSLIEQTQRDGVDPWRLALAAVVLLVVVIATRAGWIALTAAIARRRYAAWQRRPPSSRGAKASAASVAGRQPHRRRMFEKPDGLPEPLTRDENIVLSWAGMRGVVTLAAAAGTPLLTMDGAPLAGRSVIVLLAFVLAVATLLLQGTTLPWLVSRLDLPSDDDARLHQQMAHGRSVMRHATRVTIDRLAADPGITAEIAVAEALLKQAERASDARADDPPEVRAGRFDRRRMQAVTREILAGQRVALIAERDAQALDDEVLRQLLESIDLEQALLAKKGEVVD